MVRKTLILTALVGGVANCGGAAGTDDADEDIGVSESAVQCLEEKIAFVSTRDNPTLLPVQNAGDIYMMNMDGSDVVRVTDNLFMDIFPDFSPSGKWIIFDSNRLREPTDSILRSDIFIMKTDGSDQTFVTPGSSADWSPDGKHITYHASASGLYTPVRVDPGAPTIDSDIFTLHVFDALDGEAEPVNLTNTPGIIEDDPNWSPDGTKIVYAAFSATDNPNQPSGAEIYIIDAEGGTPTRLTFNTSEERAPAWSPDGSKIVFMCRYGGTDFEICTMNPDGTGLVQVTNNTVQELSIRWYPDATKFVFNRPVGGPPARNQLFSVNVNGTGETQLTNSLGLNLFPNPGLARIHYSGGKCP